MLSIRLQFPEERAELWAVMESSLEGVGDAALGEWRGTGGFAMHLRRRVTDREWGQKRWGMDYRAEPEGRNRLAEVAKLLPPKMGRAIMQELVRR